MTSRLHIGIDVAKDELIIAFSDNRLVLTLENAARPIRQWVKSLPEACQGNRVKTSPYTCCFSVDWIILTDKSCR